MTTTFRGSGPKNPNESISVTHSHWDAFFRYNPTSRHRRRLIRQLLEPLNFDNMLDIGCGNGELLYWLSQSFEFGRRLTMAAADLHHAQTPPLLATLGAYYQCLNIEKDRLPETYDLVIASEIVEHVRDDHRAAENIAAMTKRWLIVTVPSGRVYPSDKQMGHFRHYTPKIIQALFEPFGFETVKCFEWGFPFHSLYKRMLNLSPEAALGRFGHQTYTVPQIFLCHMLYGLFFLNIHAGGSQIFYLAKRIVAAADQP